MGRMKTKLTRLGAVKREDLAKVDPNSAIQMPGTYLPSFRTTIATQRGVEKNILIHTWGGLGDQVCAEPAIRYGMTHFHDCKFTLASEKPELFRHLKFEHVIDLKLGQPHWERYFTFRTIQDINHIQWEFMSHMLTQAVDYVSLCMFRLQMPIADREIQLHPLPPQPHIEMQIPRVPQVVVHAGRHWQTKTFPKPFWDAVLAQLIKEGVLPILIGANTDDNRGTVDVDANGCLDLRNQTSVNDMMWILKNADALLTNDSSPLHMAAAGRAHIGFIATCKHQDYITHWRQGIWGWRMKNFGKGGIWDNQNYCPNASQRIEVDKVDPEILLSWLPDPIEFATWAATKAFEEFSVRNIGT